MTNPRAENRQGDREWLPAEGGTVSLNFKGADYKIDPETGCWVWQRGLDPNGYGRLGPASGLERRAHREYFKRTHGPIPAGWHVHHKCENTSCVNPDHLEAKSHPQHLAFHKQQDSTLCWDDVREIRAAFKAGASQRDLGKQYAIAQPTLSDIITNTTWKDPSYKPGRPAVCALEECGADFLAERSNQRFCCNDHKRRWNSRRNNRRVAGLPLDGPSKWKRAA